MSVSVSVYIGPYVECEVVPKLVDKSECKKPGACQYPTGSSPAFCPGCGIAEGMRNYQTNERPCAEMVGEYPHHLHRHDHEKDAFHRFSPGDDEETGAPRKFDTGDLFYDGDADNDLTDISPKAEMKWLAAEFADEIKKLKEIYGAKNVSIRWGYFASCG